MTDFTGKEYDVFRGVESAVAATKVPIPALGPNDVLLKITHSGVCHTDYLFFSSGAPLALGHEGVGVVVAVGSAVTTFAVGERAAAGYHRSSCGHCNYCLTGRDVLCYSRVTFGEGDFNNGTFGEYYIGHQDYLHKIPEGMASEVAAPLQCAGATVYSALRETIKPNSRVGVLGIGGLGHLAIQYAAKMGADVVVLSTSKSKEAEARELGAKEFLLLDEVEKLERPLDVLLLTGAKYPDWDRFMKKEILARDGTIVPLSAPVQGPLTLPANPMFFQVFHVHSSLVASRAVHDEMLAFSARHDIKPILQVFKHEGPQSVTKIFEELEKNKIRYRAVLEY